MQKWFSRTFILPVLGLLFSAVTSYALDRQPNADYHARREALAKKAGGIVLLFSPVEDSESLYTFRQDDNFYYLSGIADPGPALLIAPALESKDNSPGRPYREILFLPPRNLRMERYTGPKLGPDNPDAAKITGFDRVEDMSKLPDELMKTFGSRMYLVYTDVNSTEPTRNGPDVTALLKRMTGSLYFQDIKPALTEMRMIKDAGEITLLRKSVDASVAAHVAAMKSVKPNVAEYETGALLQYEWSRRGCERAAYPPVVGSGHNSTVLHYAENMSVMKAGDVVVIDAAAECSMYAADITRTLPVGGHFTARQREIYDIVLAAQEAAASGFQLGKTTLGGTPETSIDTIGRDYIKNHGKDLHGQSLGKYFTHGIGHYLGMDVHDVGDYKIPLAPGMIFTIEPGIYIPEENIGVRIEDDYLVGTDGKLIKLSGALPSKADEIEKAMAGK